MNAEYKPEPANTKQQENTIHKSNAEVLVYLDLTKDLILASGPGASQPGGDHVGTSGSKVATFATSTSTSSITHSRVLFVLFAIADPRSCHSFQKANAR